MPYVNNNVYLELAKLDYDKCQALHVAEWGEIEEYVKRSQNIYFNFYKLYMLTKSH